MISTYRTWYGPIWTAAQSLQGVLLSIQSIMGEKPYHNEPGYEQVLSSIVHLCNRNAINSTQLH